MQKLILTTALAFAASTAMADAPNRVTMTFPEFVEASGCEIRENAAGQLNIYAADGGNCPFAVTVAFNGVGTVRVAGADGILGTADDQDVSDN